MDQVIRIVEGVGEIGIDTEASPGNGAYYVKLYDGSYDACGFDTEAEALAELEWIESANQAIADAEAAGFVD